jgi:hypothetical protein
MAWQGLVGRASQRVLILFRDRGVETIPPARSRRAPPAMSDDSFLSFDFPAVGRRKRAAAFDGGRMSPDGGVMLLAAAERSPGVARRPARRVAGRRDPRLAAHSAAGIPRGRMPAIACGYEDAGGPDHLRRDPGFKPACGRLPDSGNDPCPQPTMSRRGERPDPARGDPAPKPDCFAAPRAASNAPDPDARAPLPPGPPDPATPDARHIRTGIAMKQALERPRRTAKAGRRPSIP